jgi:hypothetical protein
MSHNKIASLAEPWFLLPIINGLRNDSLLTNYNHSLAIEAIRDFQKNLPNQRNDINQGIKQMFHDLIKEDKLKELPIFNKLYSFFSNQEKELRFNFDELMHKHE